MGYKKYIIGKQDAIERMNTWGKEKQPFLFILSFSQKENLILTKKEALDAGIQFRIGTHANYSDSMSRSTKLPSSIFFTKETVSEQ